MVSFRYPGPICQIIDWYEHDDGSPTSSQLTVRGVLTGGIEAAEARLRLARRRVVAPSSGPCAFLNPRARGTVSAPPAAFNRLRGSSGTAEISQPQARAAQVWWRGGSSFPGIEQQIRIDGQTIRVIRPVEADCAGKNLPTTVQIAEALRAVPADQRASTSKVFVSPVAAPGSTSTKTVAGLGGAGEIILFPVNTGQTQNDFDNRITHESGHNFQGKFWLSREGGLQWQVAADLDNRRPSPYVLQGSGEDFCEFNILYNASKGTPCELTCRQIYPHRWAKMTEYLSR